MAKRGEAKNIGDDEWAKQNQMRSDQHPKYLTKKWALIAFVLALPLDVLFDHLGNPGRGRAAGLAGAMIILTTRCLWSLRRRAWFWATIMVLTAAHVPLILGISWTNENLPGPTLLPFGMLDFAIMYGCIKLVEKAMTRKIDVTQ